MDVIFTVLMQIWIWQKYVPIPHKNMRYHTENLYYAVVINALVLLYLIGRQINMQQTRLQQYVFMFTAMYHVLLLMKYPPMNIEQYVICVSLILVL